MIDLLTPQTLASAGPILVDTLFRHVFSHKSLMARSSARGDDLMYDEAFVLMKTFLESATKYPLVSLQRFSNVRTPAPPWVGVHRVLIPSSTLHSAATHLIEALGGPEMAYKIAGGSRWWQVRAGGLEGEWIAMKRDYEPALKEERERMKARRKSAKEKMERQRHAEKSKKGERLATAGKVGGGKAEEADEADNDDDDDGFRQEMDEMRCMLYIHGGAYYWGSINTHRYTIWRYARKMRGRCFAVNYRKAPQYPFPCAIQDVLAAYLYLTDPPPDAPHRPVKPEHIVIAGDSAGGGLTLALLQILRDVQALQLPAGAALISPWSDLTHSFPSILSNTATDIVPPYSFIHKPSSLWPPPPMATTSAIQSGIRHKIRTVASKIRHGGSKSTGADGDAVASAEERDLAQHEHGADEFPQLYDFEEDRPRSDNSGPSQVGAAGAAAISSGPSQSTPSSAPSKQGLAMVGHPFSAPPKFRSSDMHKSKLSSFFKSANATLHPTTHRKDPAHEAAPQGEVRDTPTRANPAEAFGILETLPAFAHASAGGASRTSPGGIGGEKHGQEAGPDPEQGTRNGPTTLANCAVPLRLDVQGEPVEVDTQIQIYATNAQLCHPLVSPALGYMGGLCPLFVMCGDNEVLRDEIIYLAHKAANPGTYPIRDDVRAMMPHYEGIEERYGPTKVHLQVYDGVCHDLPLFSMCRSARGLFRAISTFSRFVTPSASSGSRASTAAGSGGGRKTPKSKLATQSVSEVNANHGSPDDAENDNHDADTRSKSTPASTDHGHHRKSSWWMTAMESMTPGRLSRQASSSGAQTPASPARGVEEQDSAIADSGAASPDAMTPGGIAGPIDGVKMADGGSVPLPLPASISMTPAQEPSGPTQNTSASDRSHGADLAHRLEKLDVKAANTTDTDPQSAVLPHIGKTASPVSLSPTSAKHVANLTWNIRPDDGSSSADPAGRSENDADSGAGARSAGVGASSGNRTGTGIGTGDESGPRWVHEPDWDQPAKEGEAGFPGVYAGQGAWVDNMIRERVDSHGVLRPLEPAEELGALTMPADEIGMIKEGPALRYLTGQYLWDKRYKEARKKVARHRKNNLKAHAKDAGRLIEGVRRKLGGQAKTNAKQESRTAKATLSGRSSGVHSSSASMTPPAVAGGLDDRTVTMSRMTSNTSIATTLSASETSEAAGMVEGGVQDDYEDWSWAWALDGDVPPPSAIVSRRDTAEARKLALTADHSDPAKGAHMSGLSIWVALTTFFSSSSERNRASDAIKTAKEQEQGQTQG